MDGIRDGRDGDETREHAYARPEWLDEFADPPRGARTDDDDPWDAEPTGWRSTVDRVRTTPRAALALCAVGLVAAVVAAVAVFGSSDGGKTGAYPVVDFAGASASAAPRSSASAAASTSASPRELVVAVVGLVRAPGLHRIAPGSRVADALTAARGTLADADTASLNLAQLLRDGDQVVVGVADGKSPVKLRSSVVPAGTGSAAGGASASGPAPSAQVNINTASAAELDRLPGVGPATAAAIIAYREQNGPFKTVDDLGKVAGIGDAKLAKITPMATV
ncbi:helix-hairpin-helix domain-containing protein [Tsukamurella paurometabola]|uniref:Competence protein ComEA helix-hairpin-helix repeat protein n=1 Tax=Tsukamurella paurometabola (strain ATCC 8368 / DSM 20162 / CCUG 35730 / CIP 100753 / JCM 10117 / KCTC 9821 / NBRC 16120 / NCIMB 702349 / NCTC 13040) TaxID=521096 RepID=D5UTB6_TSUPD|nr:helix-hairpin-helix domain-containing protein [Tsukamurella paurometabola]ADG79401.1 competence protein ComEA helix-hairpin-helix repeat protein [Tsukamurella paurometabola DSM 20162]SUP35570.1 ComE operon protein 1 [Tsukamurella paurometabola]